MATLNDLIKSTEGYCSLYGQILAGEHFNNRVILPCIGINIYSTDEISRLKDKFPKDLYSNCFRICTERINKIWDSANLELIIESEAEAEVKLMLDEIKILWFQIEVMHNLCIALELPVKTSL